MFWKLCVLAFVFQLLVFSVNLLFEIFYGACTWSSRIDSSSFTRSILADVKANALV